MTMPGANSGIAQQAADSHDVEKNIFSGEARNEGGERRGNNDPRQNKQRQNNQPRRDIGVQTTPASCKKDLIHHKGEATCWIDNLN